MVLYGTVQEERLRPIRDAGVYFKSKMYSPLVTTDYSGNFRINGICILNEDILVRKDGYSQESVTATAINGTHWKVNATIYQYGEWFKLFTDLKMPGYHIICHFI